MLLGKIFFLICSQLDLFNLELFLPQLLMDQDVKWSLRDSHAFLLMITSLLLLRQDESVVRKATQIFKEFALRLPEQYLKQLATFHNKPLDMIFHKVSKVTTYYTQCKIVEMLNVILKARDDCGSKILRQGKVLSKRSKEIVNESVHYFDCITADKFLSVSNSTYAMNKSSFSSSTDVSQLS